MSLRVVQISDSHCYLSDEANLTWATNFKKIYTNKNLKQIVNHIKNHIKNVAAGESSSVANERAREFPLYDLCVFTGDLVEEETHEAYMHIKEILSELEIPFYVLPGNHDNSELMQKVFAVNYLSTIKSSQLNKSFEDKNKNFKCINKWNFVLINTHVDGQAYGEISESEFIRIKKELSSISQNEFVAIFMHHHPVNANSEWIDNMGLKNSEKFWKIISRFNQVKAVFHGHIHQAFHSEKILSSEHVIKIYGSPAISIQGKPLSKNVEFTEQGPGFREIVFHDNGEIETMVFYI